MHLYTFTPQTPDITSVTSHFLADLDACERAMGEALRTATSRASEGDLIDAQCVVMDPPEAIAHREATHVEAIKL